MSSQHYYSSKDSRRDDRHGIKREERLPSTHHMVADPYERSSPYDFQDVKRSLPRVTSGTHSHHATQAQHSYSREGSGPGPPPATFRSSSLAHLSQHIYHPTSTPPPKAGRRPSSTNDGFSNDNDQDENGVGISSQSTSDEQSSQHMSKLLANSREEGMRGQRIEAELRRRDELRDGYAKLKLVLPPSKQKISQVSLLERAMNHIASLEQSGEIIHARLVALEAEAAHLREINERLSLNVAHDTGHIPTDAELGLPPPGEGPALKGPLSALPNSSRRK